MSPSKVTIGEILGSVHRDPFQVAAQEMEVIMPDYRDAHFDSGFGIRTTGEMTRDQLRWLLGLQRFNFGGASVFSRLLKKFGAVQIRCPEIRSQCIGSGFCSFPRSPGAFTVHKDSYAGGKTFTADDLVLAVEAGKPVSGSTMVVPDAEFLRLLSENSSTINFDLGKKIGGSDGDAERSSKPMSVAEVVEGNIDIYQDRYWHWWKTVLRSMADAFFLSPQKNRDAFTDMLEQSPHVLAHDWSTMEALGHSDRLSVHGPAKDSDGTFMMRTLHH